MARIVKNPIGELSGKAGELVFKKGKNGQYISSRPSPTRKQPSPVQQLQRDKMSLVMDFLSPMKELIKECFFPFQQNKSAYHVVKSYYLKEALLFENERYEIDYPRALMSFGDLRPPEGTRSEALSPSHSIKLSWDDNSGQALAYPDDRLLVVIHSPETKRFLYKTNLANRSAGFYEFQLNESWEALKIQLWLGFHRPGEQRASASRYVGEIML